MADERMEEGRQGAFRSQSDCVYLDNRKGEMDFWAEFYSAVADAYTGLSEGDRKSAIENFNRAERLCVAHKNNLAKLIKIKLKDDLRQNKNEIATGSERLDGVDTQP